MLKIKRLSEPDSLRINAKGWAKELMKKIVEEGSYSAVESKYKDRYRQDDVLERLKEMNSGLCCYCETKINAASYPHIEHRKPKSLFPEDSFQWENLHLACQICNTKKRDQWNEEHEILDSCLDTPADHLKYSFARLDYITDRGRTTIELCKLNRKGLLEARKLIAGEIMELINDYSIENDEDRKFQIREKLEEYSDNLSEYNSMIHSLISKYLNHS